MQRLNIKFKSDYLDVSRLKSGAEESLLAEGYAVKQLLEGKEFLRMTEKYFEELGEYIKKHPRELCIEYWERLVADTYNCDIMEFVRAFCMTHLAIKDFTGGKVDFCEMIGRELDVKV